MKVLIYFESERLIKKSGIGRALEHQKEALTSVGIEYTLDPNCEDYDILHINTYGINSLSMVNQAKKRGKKVIYHAHSNGEDFKNSFVGSNQVATFYKKYLIKLYSEADRLIAPTIYAKEILESYGIEKPISVISNGIDLASFKPNQEKEKKFREYFKLEDSQKVVISVGLYFHRKGLLDFVEVARKFPQYTFIWFGHTPLYAVPKEIRQVVQGDHPDNVIFPGYIKGEIIEGAYSNADLFFFPSYEETEGIVLLEALASHQNVLVRDIPVYKGWLEKNKNVYMGQTNDEFQELIAAIIDKKVPDLTEAGFLVAQEKSIENVGLELEKVYQTVLTEKREGY
ncbi:glycosyltransferase [Enterococcus saccharolyticus]|uniref:Glycosyl transferase family 1 n=1 Tax=Candidatus Enterococcus willemsii TaxID=1857215 RepID=A0ABQ6Z276_9ENTE|nr:MULTISPECIES: glycosyltransferase [Enterococcus]KAF1305389.1 glycosyl transferase family 1 [Enterococcus sp. CU12B]MCD5001033.1 glycosyltransferase [Enterococcus saccharolyticus]